MATYETLILQASAAAKFTPSETDVVMTFLSLVAYKLLAGDQDYATDKDLNDANNEYFDRYKVHLPYGLFERLVTARVLHISGEGYRFRYPYYSYFFVASYIR